MMIYHGSPYEVQTEISRGPLSEDEHSSEEIAGAGRPSALRPHNFFSAVVILCQTPCISVCISYGDPGWGSWHFCLQWRAIFFCTKMSKEMQNI